jgi:ribose transport system permease protein
MSEGMPAQAATHDAGRRRRDPLVLAERFGLVGLFVIVIAVFSVLRPATFFQASNASNIATSQSVLAVVALALIFPLVAGRFDVSVGGILSVSAITCAGLMADAHLPLAVAVVIAIVLGGLIGIVNGVIVAYLGVNSIITTIGTSTVMGGIVQAYTHGAAISNGLDPLLTGLSLQNVLGIPTLFLIMLALAAIAWFLLRLSPFGRRLVATGSNQTAAHLVGLRTRRIVLLSFIVSGLLAGCAGVLQIAVQGSGDPNAGGLTGILPSLAAVFLGATTWKPGTYNVPGTLIGLFFVGTTISGLVLLGVAPWVTDVLNGAAVVIAIVISAQIRRTRTGTLDIGT